ncbi:MAG TPA: hypothetical protein VJY33_10340, partial [Isosphaeraceae bacterium]|nr:hypothetical protein [Isosphaeraceae bacterium]
EVAFFDKGLIYDRDSLPSPDVMVYDTPAMGFDTAARYRLQLLDQFTDAHGLVIVDYNLPPGAMLNPSNPIADHPVEDTNDSAWMSGQAVAALAMDGDLTGAELVLSGIVKYDWSPTGDLIRYPGNANPFDGPDPYTQVAGAYFAWKFANSAGNEEVQSLAQQLIGKWIDQLYRTNGKLGSVTILFPALMELDEVATKIGIDQTRLNEVTNLINEQKAVVVAGTMILDTLSTPFPLLSGVTGTLVAGSVVASVLDNTTLYSLSIAAEAGLDDISVALPTGFTIDYKLGTLTNPELDTSGLNLMFWEDLVMHDLAPSLLLNEVTSDLANLTASYGMLPFQWLAGSSTGVAESQSYVENAGQDADGYRGPTATNPYLGNYWWRTDSRSGPGTSDVHVVSWGDGAQVPTAASAQVHNVVYVGIDNTGLLQIRVFDDSDQDEPVSISETMLPHSEAGAISILKQQLPTLVPPHAMTDAEKTEILTEVSSLLDQTASVPPVMTYNRVDYLVMRGLFNLDPGVWENAPVHLGVSVNVPIPQLGSAQVAGYVNSDGAFSLVGSGTLSPAGFSLTSTTVEVSNSGAQIWGSIALPGLGSCKVYGSVDTSGNFSLLGYDDLAPAGFSLTNTTVEVSNSGAQIWGSVYLPGLGSCKVYGSVDTSGNFSLLGYDDLAPAG